MSNNVFHFKQFSIRQSRSAMKVSADAVLFGAWIPEGNYSSIFDIGCGTGLLSLMCAQRFSNAVIDTTEIDEGAYADACENISSSPWPNRIHVFCADVRSMLNLTMQQENGQTVQVGKLYDLIVCNPPFFTSSIPAANAQRTTARHDDSLSPDTIMQLANEYLNTDGLLCVMYPTHRLDEIKKTAMKHGLYLQQLAHIRTNPQAQPRLAFMVFTRNAPKTAEEDLIVYETTHVHTERYIRLVQPFYVFMD